MRPIDADALIEKCGDWYVEEGTESGFIGTLKNLLATMPTIQPEKAQLLKEGTTSDLISRQAAIDALDFEIVHMTAYCDGKNEGNPFAQYNKGLEDGKKAIEALPSAQPVVTDTNVGDTISRQAAIDIFDDYNVSVENGELEAYRRDRKRLCELPTIQPEERAEKRMETHACDLISRQEALDALDKQIKQCCKALGSFSLSDVDKHAVEVEMASLRAYREMLENLPTAQQEPTDEQVLDYCKKRDLHLVTYDLFQSIRLNHKVSFGDKDHVWIDGKQYISLPRFQEAVKEAGPKEGYWKKDETDDCPPVFQQFRICSECGCIKLSETNFCPDCGAHMRGKHNV